MDIFNGKPTCLRQDPYVPTELDLDVGTLEDSYESID